MQKQEDEEQEKRNQKPKLPKFQGVEEAMQGHVCDVEKTGKTSEFVSTTESTRDLVCRTCQNPKLVEQILTKFKEAPLETATRSASGSFDSDKFEWQLKMKDHYRDKTDWRS